MPLVTTEAVNCEPAAIVCNSEPPFMLTVMVPLVVRLVIVNDWPTASVVASGKTTVWFDVVPVNCWNCFDETLRVVVPPAVGVVARASMKLLALRLALGSRAAMVDAVAEDATTYADQSLAAVGLAFCAVKVPMVLLEIDVIAEAFDDWILIAVLLLLMMTY